MSVLAQVRVKDTDLQVVWNHGFIKFFGKKGMQDCRQVLIAWSCQSRQNPKLVASHHQPHTHHLPLLLAAQTATPEAAWVFIQTTGYRIHANAWSTTQHKSSLCLLVALFCGPSCAASLFLPLLELQEPSCQSLQDTGKLVDTDTSSSIPGRLRHCSGLRSCAKWGYGFKRVICMPCHCTTYHDIPYYRFASQC